MTRAISRLAAVVAMVVVAGCSTAPAEHEFVTDYRIVGDKTVKYIYVPGESSRAGGRHLDQAVALEICSVELEQTDRRPDEEVEADEQAVIETDCEQTRLLKTEEYR